MASIAQIGLRGWTFLFTLLTLALVGNAIADAFSGNPSSVNFAIFVSTWSMLVLLYGVGAAFVDSLAIPVALMALDAISTLLTFIAGVVLAAKLGVHSCGHQSYLLSNSLTNGSHNMGKRCHELQASTAFYWFMFAGFAGSLVFDFLGSRSSGISSSGMRRGGPSMSQV